MSTGPTPTQDRGSATLELVILTPVLLLVLALLIGAGRVALARQAVIGAAAEAARTASLARTPGQAQADATTAGTTALTARGLTCTNPTVQVSTSGFAAPVGTAADVQATITCTASLADLSVPGMPGALTLTGSATSPLDTYRERR